MLAALAFAAPMIADPVLKPRPDTPTTAEKKLLLSAATNCNMHAGAVYFIQRQIPTVQVIHISRALGDAEAQVRCVLQSLPKDFSFKFGLDVEAPRR